jgi:hypothetical protein
VEARNSPVELIFVDLMSSKILALYEAGTELHRLSQKLFPNKNTDTHTKYSTH